MQQRVAGRELNFQLLQEDCSLCTWAASLNHKLSSSPTCENYWALMALLHKCNLWMSGALMHSKACSLNCTLISKTVPFLLSLKTVMISKRSFRFSFVRWQNNFPCHLGQYERRHIIPFCQKLTVSWGINVMSVTCFVQNTNRTQYKSTF